MAKSQDPTSSTGPIRNPETYKTTRHYRERIESNARPVTERHATNAIRNGSIERNPVDRDFSWRFVDSVDGCDVSVVVGRDKFDRRTLSLITAYADVVDKSVALSTVSAWNDWEVYNAALLQSLASSRGDPDIPIKAVDAAKPIPLHDHRVISRSGYSGAYCVDCDLKSKEMGVFETMGCY